MKFGEPQIIKLKTATPVFVGNGESVRPLSYLLEGDTAYLVKEDKFFATLSLQERDRFLGWIDPLLDHLTRLDEQLAQVRQDFERRRQLQRERRQVESNLSLRNFLANELRINPVRFIQQRDCEAYRVRCSTNPERDGFRLHLKDLSFRPYLPGTEIKGAFRTALVYTLVSSSEKYPYFRDRLEEFRRFFQGGASPWEKVRRLGRIADGLEAELLRGKPRGELKNDAKYDFLRFFHVSDSTCRSPDDLRIELSQMLGTNRYTKTWVETFAPGCEMSIKVAIGDPKFILQELGLERLREWVSLPKLLEACHHRSQDILAEEATYFAGDPTLHEQIVSLQKQNIPEAPLLRLGQGQGFLSTTVGLSIKKHDPQLFDSAIREGVSMQRRWKTQSGNFPKTRRIIADHSGIPVNLLGWVKVVPKT